jgi:4-coumarate--CoA ligase
VDVADDSDVFYKWLSGGIAFVEAIPRNPSGKLLRRLLRDKAKALKLAQQNNSLGARL